MKRKTHILLVIGLVVGLLTIPAAASAERAEVTPYTGLETPTDAPNAEPCRVTGPGLKCFQESYWFDDTTDDRTTGFTTVQANFKTRDAAAVPPSGHIWGSFVTSVYETPNDPTSELRGTWEGTWTGKLINGAPFFRAVGHGTGEFEGLKLMADFAGSTSGIAIEGRILDPKRR